LFAGQPRDLSDISDDVLQEQLTIAEREFMEARAEYLLRNRATLSVLVMDPILKAVHGDTNTARVDRSVHVKILFILTNTYYI
jgi:hypothetical protein